MILCEEVDEIVFLKEQNKETRTKKLISYLCRDLVRKRDNEVGEV